MFENLIMQSLGLDDYDCTSWSANFGSCLDRGFVLLFFTVLFAVMMTITFLVLRKEKGLRSKSLREQYRNIVRILEKYQRASRLQD